MLQNVFFLEEKSQKKLCSNSIERSSCTWRRTVILWNGMKSEASQAWFPVFPTSFFWNLWDSTDLDGSSVLLFPLRCSLSCFLFQTYPEAVGAWLEKRTNATWGPCLHSKKRVTSPLFASFRHNSMCETGRNREGTRGGAPRLLFNFTLKKGRKAFILSRREHESFQLEQTIFCTATQQVRSIQLWITLSCRLFFQCWPLKGLISDPQSAVRSQVPILWLYLSPPLHIFPDQEELLVCISVSRVPFPTHSTPPLSLHRPSNKKGSGDNFAVKLSVNRSLPRCSTLCTC